jgi:hypothetical protein
VRGGDVVRRVLLGILGVVERIITTVLALGCVVVILVAVMLVFLWLVLK